MVGGKELIIIDRELSLSHPTAIELQLIQLQESDLLHIKFGDARQQLR